jgi:hypothetical protein
MKCDWTALHFCLIFRFLFHSTIFGMVNPERWIGTLDPWLGAILRVAWAFVISLVKLKNFLNHPKEIDSSRWLRKSRFRQMYTKRLIAELQQNNTYRYPIHVPNFVKPLYDITRRILGHAINKTSTEVIIRVRKTSFSSFFMSVCLPIRFAPMCVKILRTKARSGKTTTMVEM